jgi:hypothetical protein
VVTTPPSASPRAPLAAVHTGVAIGHYWSDEKHPQLTAAGRIAGFVCVALAAMFALNWLIDAGLRSVETSSFGVLNGIVDGRINAAVLITGSSRALNHYDPREITASTGRTAYNVGINGSQTDMQLAVLRTYLNHNVPPSLVIHNLDSFTFVTSRAGIAFPGDYVPYLNESPIYETLSTIDANWWKSRYLPLYGYAVYDMRLTWLIGLRRWLGLNPREVRFGGFEPRQRAWSEDFERFRRSHSNGVRFEVEPQGMLDFEELVALCQRRGIRLLLVYSPVYYEMQALELQRQAMFDQFRDIANRYGAQLWDYSQSSISFRREYFYNSQHLNANGAAVFSADLAKRLKDSDLLRHH